MIASPTTRGHSTALWEGVDRLIDRAPSVADLRAHRLHVLAARSWRLQRRPVPDELGGEEMEAAGRFTVAIEALRQARTAYCGEMLVLKGPQTASLYPAPHLRPFSDVDVLVDAPECAYRALLAAGFMPTGFEDRYYEGLHHLRPLVAPGIAPVRLEIHRWPNWPSWGKPPHSRELLEAAIPDMGGVDGLAGLAPAHHALVLAVHSWVELPLRRLGDLVDISAAFVTADADEVGAAARAWGVTRLWNTTLEACQSLLFDGPQSFPLRSWARNLEAVRDRTVLETHLRRVCSPFWAQTALPATHQLLRAVADAGRPAPSDTWQTKLRRTQLAIRSLSRPSAEHTEDLGPDGHRAPHFRTRY